MWFNYGKIIGGKEIGQTGRNKTDKTKFPKDEINPAEVYAGSLTPSPLPDGEGRFLKVPPHSKELEMNVLGAMMVDGSLIDIVVPVIKPEMMYFSANTMIFKAIIGLHDKHLPVDTITLTEELKSRGELDAIGGPAYIAELSNAFSSHETVQYSAEKILEAWVKRDLILLTYAINEQCYDPTMESKELLDQTQRQVMDIGEKLYRKKHVTSNELFDSTMEHVELIAKGNKDIIGIPSGYVELDVLTSGFQKSELIIIAGRPSHGKALPLSNKILTPVGWVTMKDIKVGNKIVGSDGNWYKVTGVYPQGKRDVYGVWFDDNTSVKCDIEHLWAVTDRASRKHGKGMQAKERILTTREMIDSIKIKAGRGERNNYALRFIAPAQFREKPLPLNPWLLGIYLGDGDCGKAVRLTNSEPDIISKFRDLINSKDELSAVDSRHYRIKRKKRNNTKSEFYKVLKKMGLCGKDSFTKFIPEEYLFNSVKSRVLLLQGLIDSDGHVNLNPTKQTKSNCIEFSTVSSRLKEGIVELIRGLGGKATWVYCQGAYRKNGVKHLASYYWRIQFTMGDNVIPVSSEKHLKKYTTKKKYHRKFIEEIKYAGQEECQCITVDSPDNLFITDNYTLTHNSALALNIARNAAEKHHKPGAIFSIEMSTREIGLRKMALDCECAIERLKTGRLVEAEWDRIAKRGKSIKNQATIIVDDSVPLTLMEMKSKTRRMVAEYGIEWVMVDYLQLMDVDSSEKRIDRHLQIAIITKGLKQLSKELDIPVIALSQLSRKVEDRGGEKRPQLSDLRESGSIEQDADVVIFINRPEVYMKKDDVKFALFHGLAEVIVGKQRNGPVGDVKLTFRASYAKFDNRDRTDDAGQMRIDEPSPKEEQKPKSKEPEIFDKDPVYTPF